MVFKLVGRKLGKKIFSVIIFGDVVFASFAGTARAVFPARLRSSISTDIFAALYDRHDGLPALLR